MTMVTADDKGRVCIRGTKAGHKYVVQDAEGGWWVKPAPELAPPKFVSRNRKQWAGPRPGRDLGTALEELGKLGLQLEESEAGKHPVPPCRF
jgi:hypothetical protein